jgi:hypothetical protein
VSQQLDAVDLRDCEVQQDHARLEGVVEALELGGGRGTRYLEAAVARPVAEESTQLGIVVGHEQTVGDHRAASLYAGTHDRPAQAVRAGVDRALSPLSGIGRALDTLE